ncbi:hypothetical protein ACS0TY_001869 [Phlomoides rotata]
MIMSCNGCRILRKGCNDNCILRDSLRAIETPQAQANATLFVAKFFGRAGLISFLSSVSDSQRPALFQSLLFEACGRTVNPVNGAVGLLWTGNWHLCQSAVDTVLRGGVLRPLPELDLTSDANNHDLCAKGLIDIDSGLHLATAPDFPAAAGRVNRRVEKRRPASPSDESETTTLESGSGYQQNCHGRETKLLRLFF